MGDTHTQWAKQDLNSWEPKGDFLHIEGENEAIFETTCGTPVLFYCYGIFGVCIGRKVFK